MMFVRRYHRVEEIDGINPGDLIREIKEAVRNVINQGAVGGITIDMEHDGERNWLEFSFRREVTPQEIKLQESTLDREREEYNRLKAKFEPAGE